MTLTDEAGAASPWPSWTFGDMLRKAREEAGISSKAMAVRLGVARNTITNYEHNHTVPPRSTVALWAQITGAPEAALLAEWRRRFTSLNPQLSLFDVAEVIDLRDHATVHPLRRASDHPNEVGGPLHLDAVSGF